MFHFWMPYFLVYAPDMPKRLPIRDIISGLLRSVSRAVRYWLHYTLVTIAWLGVVPIAAGMWSSMCSTGVNAS